MPRAYVTLRSIALIAAFACMSCNTKEGAPAATSNEAAPSNTSGRLDCAWIADTSSCWRTFSREISNCLAMRGEPLKGALSADGKTCADAVPGAPMMSLAKPIAPMGADGAAEAWDFTIGVGDRPCLHFVSSREGTGEHTRAETTLGGPRGTMRLVEHGLAMELTCADGARYALDPADPTIESCLTEENAAGIPIARIARAPEGFAVEMSGVQTDPTFVCQTTR